MSMPKFVKLTNEQKWSLQAQVLQLIDQFPPQPCCIDCVNRASNEAPVKCKLAGYAVPPPEVQANGCPSFEHDDIPF